MKFGDFIEDHLVSEWRSQYLDYFKGKTKVRKLSKFLGTSTGCQCNSTGTPNYKNNDYDLKSSNNSNIDLHSVILSRDRNRLDYQRQGNNNPQILFDNTDMDVAGDLDDFKVTPLFDELDNIESNESVPLLSPLFHHHRSHSTSVLYIKNQGSNFKNEDVGIIKLARQKFFEWVDSELTKVNNFYKHKEIECTKRFLILLDQLDKLHEKEIEFRNGNLSTFLSSSSSTNDTSNCYHHSQRPKKNRKLLNFDKILSTESILKRCYFIFDYFEMPSFPKFFWLQQEKANNISIEYQNKSNTPYKIDDSEPPIFISKIMIKKAICELYHKLELLNSFRVVNSTAFRKLIKKYDKRCNDNQLDNYMKKVDSMYFNKSKILNILTLNVEETFTNIFENGHRKTAIRKLRSFEIEKTHYKPIFLSGYLIGLSCPFLIFFLLEIFLNSKTDAFINQKYSLQLWGSLFLFILTGLLFSINCVVWDKYKINYKLVFELNPQDALDYKQFLAIPSTLLFIGTLLAYFSYNKSIIELLDFKYFSLIYFYILLIILFCPLNIFYLKARIWFIVSIFRLLLSGFYPVEFRDFFMGVMTCSLTYSISNIYMLFCLENNNWNNCLNCGPMKSYPLGIIACLPPIWRSLQCLRRFLDTGEWFPHFANLLKYLITTAYFSLLSIYRILTFKNPIINEEIKSTKLITSIFIFISLVNSIYSSFWDIFMDWSLVQLNSENYLLRDILIYKRKGFYYFGIIIDIVFRFQWVVYVFTPYYISHNPLTAFLVALCEILRRFIWMFFRMENEHASNVNLFRVSRTCAIPYSFSIFELIESRKLSKFSEDHLNIKINSLFNVNNNRVINNEPIIDVSNNTDIESMISNNCEDDIDYIKDDVEISSIYSSVTQRTQIMKPSNWQQLSRIMSNAHTKEFQQRDISNGNNGMADNKRMNKINNLNDDDYHESLDLDEQLDQIEDDEDAIIDDDDDDDDDEDDGGGGSCDDVHNN